MIYNLNLDREKLTKNCIVYLIDKLNSKGISINRTKLMKLMFLVEHYNIESNRIEKNKKIGNEFIIYNHGVFSFDVFENMLQLIREGIISEEFGTLKKISDMEIELPKDLEKVLDKIIEKFGSLWTEELISKTLEELGIKENEKEKYFGKSIEEILR